LLIILEGPDGAGKSTLAREIADQLCPHVVKMLHAGPPTAHPIDEYVTPLLDYRPGAGSHIICDRWHLGEMVYPQILERPTQWNIGIERLVHRFLRSVGACVVLLQPTLSELRTRLDVRGDDLITSLQLEDITRAYANLPAEYFDMRCEGLSLSSKTWCEHVSIIELAHLLEANAQKDGALWSL
jgi:thymidylate kinase